MARENYLDAQKTDDEKKRAKYLRRSQVLYERYLDMLDGESYNPVYIEPGDTPPALDLHDISEWAQAEHDEAKRIKAQGDN